jgi:hypothetical protein
VKLIKWETDPEGAVVGVGFHDGYFYGVVERRSGLIIHPETYAGEPRRIQLSGLTEMNVTNFWAGSIIGGVWLCGVARVSRLMWEKLFAGRIATLDPENSLQKLIQGVRGRYFFSLEASYGGNVYAVCHEMKITDEAYIDPHARKQNGDEI